MDLTLGPAISAGVEYGNLLLQTRLNGEVVQRQSTSDLIFDCPSIVSWVSGWVTLMPGSPTFPGLLGSFKSASPSKLTPDDVVTYTIHLMNAGAAAVTVRVPAT